MFLFPQFQLMTLNKQLRCDCCQKMTSFQNSYHNLVFIALLSYPTVVVFSSLNLKFQVHQEMHGI